jgi:uncharacterized repeat protein (TIGR03833 family)
MFPSDVSKQRENIIIGTHVEIYLKDDRSGNNPVQGVVKEILTHSYFHPYGIMVALEDGSVGRVQKILSSVTNDSNDPEQLSSSNNSTVHRNELRNNSDKITQYLLDRNEPYCDDCLSKLLEIYPRQTINQICRKLENQKKIERGAGVRSACSKNKIVNVSGSVSSIQKGRFVSKKTSPHQKERIDFPTLIQKGEDEFVEFKTSALWSKNLTEEQIKAPTASREVRAFGREASKVIIAKVISGFLNTKGGNLVIGIKENKTRDPNELIGIESEFGKLEDPCTDGYRRILVDSIIRKYFHPDIYNHFSDYIKITFPEIDGKIVCWVQISKSDVPAFLTIQKNDYFFIRMDAETRELDGKEMVEYCTKRF